MQHHIMDTNVILRFILNDNKEQHTIAKNFIQKAIQGEYNIYIPTIVLFEVNWVLKSHYKIEKSKIIDIIQTTIDLRLELENQEIIKNTLIYFERNNISLEDSYLLAASKYKKAQLMTFDKALLKAYKSLD